ncbi:MAG: hypothetical protein EZS28_034777 [Streblomastix strix]|uniref:Uncharacterized protein n=1 Tax=Streblomastix strix TaxID=222440 RepID=A0A5J4UH21_9EUKA|nr:MAG: hypothetical protein EZS28_034777 [Streblomastix strix]
MSLTNARKDTFLEIANKIGDQFDLREQLSFYNNPDKKLKAYREEDEKQTYRSLDAITIRTIAKDIMQDQIQAQIIAKNMIDNSIGIGDPSLVAISNVNAQIAAGLYNYKDVQPYRNYNALQDQPSQDISNKYQPITEYKQRIDNINVGNEKEKEQEFQQDKEFQTVYEQEQLDNAVLLDVPPASTTQPSQQPQEQQSLVKEEAEQSKIEDLQSQQMIEMNNAMNYKLGSMDWGLNSLNANQFPKKDISMRITDKTPSFIQMNKVLTKAEKVNQAKIKKNFISEKQMITQLDAQKQLKKKYGKKQPKKKGKKST